MQSQTFPITGPELEILLKRTDAIIAETENTDIQSIPPILEDYNLGMLTKQECFDQILNELLISRSILPQ